MARRNHIISGIDIGNSQAKVVIAKINGSDLKPEVLGAGSVVSSGLRRGMVWDMEEAISSLSGAIDKAQAMAGEKIKRAYLSVSGLHIRSQVSRGVIAVSRADNEISQNDIDRVIKAASVVNLPPNREIIDIIPKSFIVDGTEYVKNPLGMKGVRLEADVLIIDGLSPYLRNLVKCANENNIEVAGLVYAPLASALSSLDKSQKEYGVINLDFGGGTSTLTVFEEADMIHSAVLPVGSQHITKDLAVLLRTSMDVAEKVKIEHGSTSNAEDLRKKSDLDLSDLSGEQDHWVQKRMLLRVIDARVHELLDMVTTELKKISKSGILPAGLVLSGGGSNLPGLVVLTKDKIRLPVRLARSIHFEGIAEVINDPSYASAMGAILWGMGKELEGYRGRSGSMMEGSNVFGKVTGWLKNFMP